MVVLTKVFYAHARKRMRKYLRSGFRDSLKIIAEGGTGGNGLPKFGGLGGKGGDVIAVGNEEITLETLYHENTSKIYVGAHGNHATHNFILGRPGEDLTIEVPVGVSFITELGKKLGEINENGEKILLAKGGTGGHSKNGYLGTKGQSYPVILDLKLIADIGLVGFPNAGKSTLLKAISQAKPKIASYPFTTVRPNLGILMYKDSRKISMADLPGLIEGAHLNQGMGHRFLKHVERTKMILMIVDVNGFQLGPQYPFRSALDTILLLNKELEMYNEDLLAKPSMLLVNKMDSDGAVEKFKLMKQHLGNFKEYADSYPDELKPNNLLKFTDIIPISAKENVEDVNFVKNRLRNMLDVVAELEQQSDDRNAEIYDKVRLKMTEKGPKLV